MKRFALTGLSLVALIAFAQSAAPSVEETVAALEGGVTNIPLEAALANIQGWQTTLEASDDTALQELGTLLGDLAAELQAETINPAEIGNLLTSLGEGTSLAAESAGDEQLASLGALLTQTAGSLTGGDASGGAMSGGMTGGMMSGGGM